MDDDRVADIDALLVRAEQAHGAYEATELNGVYDQDWPRWYAAFAVEHGIGSLVGREVTTDELASFLATSYGEFETLDPKPTERWSMYTARRLAAELSTKASSETSSE